LLRRSVSAFTSFFIGLLLMNHLLDNPVWNALNSGNKHLANGNDTCKYFDKEVSPFVALRDNTADNSELLYETVQHDGPVLLLSNVEMEVPAQWKLLQYVKGVQMLCDTESYPYSRPPQLVTLTDEHIPQMLALTKLTNPGPFAPRSIDFGHYEGIFEGEQLVAMAGQRMNPVPYAEVSAVCTHPDHTGKGYARLLLQYQVGRIQAEGNIPFLHVRHDNHRAIRVYESLGFRKRITVHFYAMIKV
jgi:ribosomal protein S18 acetylase RimI-like enzyme